MFLQRLKVARPGGHGFDYDYMGSAEFEFGTTRKSRSVLAKLQIEGNFGGRQMRFTERFGRSTRGPIAVYLFGRKGLIDGFRDDDLIISVDKTSARIEDEKIVGWMSVRSDEPILILRADPANIDRGNKFLQVFIDGILQEENEASERLIYNYNNGWTLRRVTGSVYLPQNDGIPIEGGGQWVMFDEHNKAVDRDKYFSDITERYQRRIGDPLPLEN